MNPVFTVTVRDQAGNETVQSVEIPLTPGGAVLSGNVSGTYGDAYISGDLNLTGDLIIEGLLTGVDTFTVEGNGFQLLFQNGGRPNLAGVEKTAWAKWGDPVVGWAVGDRVAVAPTAVGIYAPTETTWGAARPANSPDVTLVDGSVARPEVVNLTQTIVLKNLRRIHFHDQAGVASLKWLRVLNSGTAGVLSEYPIHFHLNGDASRGSVLEGVVVEGGKNHAFVPHGSHGIAFPGCAAYNTTGYAYWWDKPPADGSTVNDSDDINWDDTLAMWVKTSTMPGESTRVAGYFLGAGTNLSCLRAAAVSTAGSASSGARQRSGFHWPENASRTPWDFRDCVAHNNVENGIFTWQNTIDVLHFIEDFVAYRNGYAGVNHGAYINRYRYTRLALTENPRGIVQHAKTPGNPPTGAHLLFEDILSDTALTVTEHNSASMIASEYHRIDVPGVIYLEGTNGSYNIFKDSGLTPTDFNLAGVSSGSIIEIVENGVLIHRWQSGVWT